MQKIIRIGTRDSQLALWQATEVQRLLVQCGYTAQLVPIKSEGDVDLITPLYAMGVQGVFTRSLDIALLNNVIDIAVHSMKDVPTQLPNGIVQSAVLKRANYKDILVLKSEFPLAKNQLEASENVTNSIRHTPLTIATSSVRRKAQWLHRYPHDLIENIRGNVNTRLQKLGESQWAGAIFAAAGLERINVRPKNSVELDWMLPAPAQGAIMVVCREEDSFFQQACDLLNDVDTALCTKIERQFLKNLLGGCSTPISALATIINNQVFFKGNIVALDGSSKVDIEKTVSIHHVENLGNIAAEELILKGGKAIIDAI